MRVDGEQYVAIAAGGVAIQTTSANGDMIWAFSLKGSPGGRLHPFDPPRPPQTVVGFRQRGRSDVTPSRSSITRSRRLRITVPPDSR